jgi:hypothetical protein
MVTKKTRKKIWYVEPIDGHTNEVIATELPAENAHKKVVCRNGPERNFWECDYRFITKLLRNEAIIRLRFNVFYRERPYGPVKLWPFLRKRRMSLTTALERGVVRRTAKAALARPAKQSQ